MSCEVLVEPHPLDGETNMARDAEMLQSAVDDNRCRLRIYEWDQPTISLGYFQKPDSVPAEFSELPCVRRLSGGGAILHHDELTYSCALPAQHPRASRPTELYDVVHEQIIRVIRNSRIAEIEARGTVESGLNEPFLCFLRQDPHDLVFGSHKVLGSAQRRRKGSVLQHGSLLLRASPFAKHLPGILDLGGLVECSVLAKELSIAISSVL